MPNAGYFRSSLLEVAGEAITGVSGKVRIICNSDLDPDDLATATAAQAALRRSWCAGQPELAPPNALPRYKALYDALLSDKIEIRDKTIFINGKPMPQQAVAVDPAEKVFKTLDDPKYSPDNMELMAEKLDGIEHPVLLDKSNFTNENFGPIEVPAESLFVMGDNRDFSNDSRYWGFVPFHYVKGKAVLIWLSIWMNFSDGQFTFRSERIGNLIH